MQASRRKSVRIRRTNLDFEREPLIAPFGFKGGFLSEIWQTIALVEGESGQRGIGLGVQSVLWSDPAVFVSCSEAAGNAIMLLLTSFALQEAQKISFESPIELLEDLLPRTMEFGRTLTRSPALRTTFALNALVAVDNAVWLLYAAEHGIADFDALIPEPMRPALSCRHKEVISVPAVGYGMGIADIVQLIDDGYFMLKIKVGSDPDRDGDPEKMLTWDCERLRAIHEAVKDRETPGGPVWYYLDANGRYDSKERLFRFLDFAEQIGALARVNLLEEPFPEEVKVGVEDVPVCVVADESAHTDHDALERIELGYGAIALKPIAKTMSMSLKIAQIAHERGVPCFCADLTVNPILVDWNKVVACRLTPLPGLNVGLLENNGYQNYKHWSRMQTYHPAYPASWMQAKNGVFHLNDVFYARSGGIFSPSPHYTLT
jgi:L-alanine-DL-glutamate epimerase-like enolase superfamily enzyme